MQVLGTIFDVFVVRKIDGDRILSLLFHLYIVSFVIFNKTGFWLKFIFQTRAREWLFSSEEGQWLVVESSKAARLVMVLLFALWSLQCISIPLSSSLLFVLKSLNTILSFDFRFCWTPVILMVQWMISRWYSCYFLFLLFFSVGWSVMETICQWTKWSVHIYFLEGSLSFGKAIGTGWLRQWSSNSVRINDNLLLLLVFLIRI